MKPNIKVGSFLLAIVMMFSVFAIAGCTPTTLNKEWSYKTSDNELAIGVYIYSLNAAYSQAESFAKKLDDYDSTSDKWLDEKIKDDDGNEQVAREWIKDQAKKMCLSYLVVDEQLKKENVNIGQATLDSATSQAETYWNVGPYASQGYVMPMKKQYESTAFHSTALHTAQLSTTQSMRLSSKQFTARAVQRKFPTPTLQSISRKTIRTTHIFP